MTKRYVQCRLRRPHAGGSGYAEMVAYLPSHGTNGLEVATGRSVAIAADADPRPWSILSASDVAVDAAFIDRKEREGRRLSRMLR